jgi:hypothetical protein
MIWTDGQTIFGANYKILSMSVSGVAFCASLFAIARFSQQAAGTIVGTVLDPNGKPITGTGSSIYLKNTASGAELVSAILADGTYKVAAVAPGGL